uniref:TAFH domain-containing protein n=1 Tax=Tetraodon nigroviridis TaxID=99883 RepID=H3CYU9_TETNG
LPASVGTTTPGCSPPPASTTSAAGVNATSSGSVSHRAPVTTLTESAVSTLATTQARISTTSERGSKVVPGTATVATAAPAQPRPGLSAPQRIVAPQLIVRPPQQQTTIQLPPGFTIPPGMVLVRTELGQLVMVPQQALAQVQAQAQAQAQNNISPRPATPTTGASYRVATPQSTSTSMFDRQYNNNAKKIGVQCSTLYFTKAQPLCRPVSLPTTVSFTVTVWKLLNTGPALRPLSLPVKDTPKMKSIIKIRSSCFFTAMIVNEMQENVKKCKNFLATLIKLASHNSPSPETSKNVKALVQDLLDAKIEPEEFTSRLQAELKSSPQPYLVPFLKTKTRKAFRECRPLTNSLFVDILWVTMKKLFFATLFTLLKLMSMIIAAVWTKHVINNSVLNGQTLPTLLQIIQQSLTQPPQQGVKTAPGGTPTAMVTGPAVRIHHPNSISTTGGANVLPTGTLAGHSGAVTVSNISLHYISPRIILSSPSLSALPQLLTVAGNVGAAVHVQNMPVVHLSLTHFAGPVAGTKEGIKTAGAVGGHVRMPVVITQSVRAQGMESVRKKSFSCKYVRSISHISTLYLRCCLLTLIHKHSSHRSSQISPQHQGIMLPKERCMAVQISGNQKNKLNDPGGGSFRRVAAFLSISHMGTAGYSLSLGCECLFAFNSYIMSQLIEKITDELNLILGISKGCLTDMTAKRFGVTEVPMEAVTFISHAAQSRLRTVIEKVSTVAQHRLDSCKDDEYYEQTADVRSQLRFFEQLERIEKQRKDEQEREILLKAAKSRSRQEDPEQARLKQKAKEMQQQELAQMRQRDANLTALAAIGPRKKRKADS